jgi:ferredoxin
MKVTIDENSCTECGVCADTLPEMFEMADDGKGKVLQNPVPADLEDATREVADACPTGAIVIEE